MENSSGYNLKNLAVWLVAAFVLIFAVFQFYSYLTKARLSLKTDNKNNYVRVEQILEENDKTDKPFRAEAQGSLSLKLKPGKYQLYAFDSHGANGTSQVVEVHARQKLSYTLNPAVLRTVEPVYGASVYGVRVDKSALYFVDSSRRALIKTTAGNKPTTLFPDHSFFSFKWSNGFGIGLDQNDKLAIVKDNHLISKGLPFAKADNTIISYDVAADGKVYVTNNNTVYEAPLDGTFKKLYSAEETISDITAGSNSIVFVQNNPSTAGIEKSDIVRIDRQGNKTKTSEEVSSTHYSPSGKYILAKGEVGAENIIFDNNLHEIESVTINQADNFTWFDDSKLLYSVDSQLWSYDLKTQTSQKLASLVAKETITAIYPSSDGSSVYFTDDNGVKQQLFKVELSKKQTSSTLTPLAVYLPVSLDSCTINYLNFSGKPGIIMRVTAKNVSICKVQAAIEMVQDGFRENSFNYIANIFVEN